MHPHINNRKCNAIYLIFTALQDRATGLANIIKLNLHVYWSIKFIKFLFTDPKVPMVNGKCVKTLAEEFLFSGTSCVHLCKLKSSEKSVKNGYMYQCNGNGKMTEAPMMVFCGLPEPRKDILFRIYSLFIFLAADKNFYLWYSPSSSSGRQRRRGSVMSEPYYVIIIGPYYYNSHITPAPPPATSCHCWHGPVLTHTPGQPHRRLLHVIGMWCATKMVAYLLW